ncbi:MAG TPA: hypothetical protein VJM51_08350 [Dehalococcoidia bacterium]|nr:hypothetical protein [Dehalococcoidia bacterium]
MIRLKEGARPIGLRPETLLAILVAKEVWASFGTHLVITSINDGTHMRKSEHSTGLAFDCRTHNLQPEHRPMATALLRESLGTDYDVIHENVGTIDEHVHVEYDPL